MPAEKSVDVERLGQAVDDTLGNGPRTERRAAQLDRLVESLPTRRRPVVKPWVMIATATAAAGLVALWWMPDRTEGPADMDRPDHVAAHEQVPSSTPPTHDPAKGTWLRAPEDEARRVVARDGVSFTLEPGSTGRLTDASRNPVLALEAGAVEAQVVPDRGLAFAVEAGPYQVRVVGTRFRVGWRGSSGTIDVDVERGAVRVRGPGVDQAEGLLVSAGMHLTGDADRREVTVRDSSASAAGEPAEDSSSTKTTGTRPQRDGGRSAASPTMSWMDLARAGRYRDAMAEVDAIGFDRIVRRADRQTLALLADAARLAREARRAQRVLDELRRLHPKTREGRRAAFHLARIAADTDHDFSTAARWLRAYLKTSPLDTFSREARGRLMDALYRTGDMDDARVVARDYLRRHPNGPHAEVAHSLLGS